MKHTLITLSLVAVLSACGSSDDDNTIAPSAPEFIGEFAGVATKDTDTGNPSGQVKINDPNPGESLYYPLETLGKYGEFVFNAAGEWHYTLWRGNSDSETPEHADVTALVKAGLPDLTETFTVTTMDGTERQFTVTIRGIDEPATFGGDVATKYVQRDTGKGYTSGTVTITDANPEEAYFKPVLEQPNSEPTDVEGVAKITTSYGEVTIKVIDPVVAVEAVPADPENGIEEVKAVKAVPGKVEWTYDLDEMNQDVIDLADATESINDTLTLISADGTEQQVIILVRGSDPVAAKFAGHSSLTAKEDGSFSAKITVNEGALPSSFVVTDPNYQEAAFKPLDGQATSFGRVSIDAVGLWTYTLDHNNSEVQALLYSETTDTPRTIEDTLTFESIDGTKAIVKVTIEGSQLVPAVIAGLPAITDGASSSTVHIKERSTSGSLTITDVNSWQASFIENSFYTSYGSFSISALGSWSYTLSSDAVELVEAGTLTLPLTEKITVTSVDGTEVTLPVTILGLDQLPPNKYLKISSKGGKQGIINIDGFGKKPKGMLSLDVRMTNGPDVGYLQLFGANSNNPNAAMVDLQLKKSGVIAIRHNSNIDGSVKYPADKWFPVEMTWDSTQTPAQIKVTVDGSVVSDFATKTSADVSAGVFRLSFRCGRGSDNPATECDFDNIKVTQDTADGEKVAVNEDFQGFELGEVKKSADTRLASGGKIKKHSGGYKHLNSEILEEEVQF